MLPIIAYLDPGSGSLVLQMLIGGILGAIVFFKLMWQRIKRGIARMLGRPVEEDIEGEKPAGESDT